MNNIIFTSGGGRLGNQLINYFHLLALKKEYPSDFTIIDLPLQNYTEEYFGDASRHIIGNIENAELGSTLSMALSIFSHTFKENPSDKIKSSWNLIQNKALHWIAHLGYNSQSIVIGDVTKTNLPGVKLSPLSLHDLDDIAKLKKKKNTFLAGWGVRGWPLVQKHQDVIRNEAQPQEKYQRTAGEFINTLRDQFEIVVGVLIRQSDYRQWSGGKYFFETEKYVDWMVSFQEYLDIQKVVFVVASEEDQQEEKFNSLNVKFATGEAVGDGHFLESFVELSLCDYILTPPSTFSTVAAFLGKIPIVPLTSEVNEDNFEILNHNIFDALEHKHMNQSVK